MQRLDDRKRHAIMQEAAKMFAAKPFHEVRLEDVAAAVGISKGTVYLYYKSKEDLYDSLLFDAFDRVTERLTDMAALGGGAWERFEGMTGELVQWAHDNPHFFQMMRNAATDRVRPRIKKRRQQLGGAFAAVLREGVANRELRDPHPDLTGQFVPAMVRSAFTHGPGEIVPAVLTRHILHVLSVGIRRETP
ncbi:MAG TPA: TetR/AcrR family transcriptional regulator [Tepidisphaeraceae bacterium]|jgi:TetR/AcrR family fatty acid metabolism transcriptional regulator